MPHRKAPKLNSDALATNKMKRCIKLVVSVLVISILAIIANHFIYYSDGSGKSFGCLEYLFFRRAIFNPASSDNDSQMNRAQWDAEEIIDLIDTYGTNLFFDESNNDLRLFALEVSGEAIETSESVEIIYLKQFHKKLPKVYKGKFIKSLLLWEEGLSKKDWDKFTEGTVLNSEYYQWLNTQNLTNIYSD